MKIFGEQELQKSIHFIGIGGSGMAPLANIAIDRGFNVTGSDEKYSEIISKFKSKGINVNIGHASSNVKNIDYVVYSAAIKNSNPELVAAKEKNIITIKRSKFLGDLTKDYSKFVAVSGSHGKTTTSLMIADILVGAGRDPTVIIGAQSKQNDLSYRSGKSEYAVCEACEFMDSFLDLEPSIGVILNIDNDHLDYFKNIEAEKESFGKFAKKCRKVLIINGEDFNTVDVVSNINIDKIFYGIKRKENFKEFDFYAQNLEFDEYGFAEFDMISSVSKNKTRIKLKIPGIHNVSNAIAAGVVCEKLGVEFEDIKKILSKFTGAKRRFEKIGEIGGITIVDDYAHHPTEINSLVNIVSNFKKNNVWAIFQPHTFSRTFLLLDDFVEVLSKFDNVILCNIFASREINTYDISSKNLAEKLNNCRFVGDFEEICDYILKNVKSGDLIFTIGAGNIDDCGRMILENLKLKSSELIVKV